jgi:RimJ/RimL family protein N-acetyltransferase
MVDIRILQPGDEAVLEAFLLPCLESSMFLIGNCRAAGLLDRGKPLQGTYAGAFQGGRLIGVVAHYWNGNLILQAPEFLQALIEAAVRGSGRALGGLIGPAGQVGRAKDTLGVAASSIQLDETEYLYSLDLAGLIVPESLRSGRLQARRCKPGDLDLLTRWRVGFSVESLGAEDTPQLWRQCRASVERSLADGRTWLLIDVDRPVSTSSFNTAIDEAVQVGGVWTPPELRSRGYGRSVVAASLLDARAEGVVQSILFTGVSNLPAQRAYSALGFRYTGDYRLLLLRDSA